MRYDENYLPIQSSPRENTPDLARRLAISNVVFTRLCLGAKPKLPTFALFLTAVLAFGWDPLQVLYPESTLSDYPVPWPEGRSVPPSESPAIVYASEANETPDFWPGIRSRLEETVNSGALSIGRFAARENVSVVRIKNRFPELCAALSVAHRRRLEDDRKALAETRARALERAFLELTAQHGDLPSLSLTCQHGGVTVGYAVSQPLLAETWNRLLKSH